MLTTDKILGRCSFLLTGLQSHLSLLRWVLTAPWQLPCQGCMRIKHPGVTSGRSLAPKCTSVWCHLLHFIIVSSFHCLPVHMWSVLEEKRVYFGMTLLKYLFFTDQKQIKALSQNQPHHPTLQEQHTQHSAHLLVFSSLALLYIHDYLLSPLLRENSALPGFLCEMLFPHQCSLSISHLVVL